MVSILSSIYIIYLLTYFIIYRFFYYFSRPNIINYKLKITHMKKITFIFAMAFVSISMFAQTIVSTTAENKNVVLEEFTGIHCGYCPDGHKVSNQIAAANPGDYFAINIHTGGYAAPQTGEPDFRTTWGTAIAGQTGLTGYPSGTINRHVFSGSTTALNRGSWSASTTTIVGQASYVNIAATASVDLTTRAVSILVEMYITNATAAPANLKLNVAVLQNNIVGPQGSGSTNPSQSLPNGMYNHMHMLRDLITGQWGEDIAITSGTAFYSKTYTYTAPADITGVPMKLEDLEFIAFLTETQQEIITGNEAVMSYITPPGVDICDLSIENLTTTPGICDATVVPSVKVKNNSATITADTFNVKYSLNGGADVVQVITAALAPGAEATFNFPAVNITESNNEISLNVNFDGVATKLDIPSANNTVSTGTFNHMPNATIGTIYSEDFESYAGFEKNINNTIISGEGASKAFTVNKTKVGTSQELGAFGNSVTSYVYNYYGISNGKKVSLMFHKMDFSSNTGYGLKFNYAYAQYGGTENDKLEIRVSTDCGATFTTLWSKAGADLKTSPPVGNNKNFFPAIDQWAAANIDLSAYNNTADVIIEFLGTSDFGNNLYVDDIRVYNSTDVSIATPENNNTVSVYPNPAVNQFNLDIELAEKANVTYSVLNNLGQEVINADLGTLNAGSQNQKVNISELAQGIYVIQININNSIITKKLTVN